MVSLIVCLFVDVDNKSIVILSLWLHGPQNRWTLTPSATLRVYFFDRYHKTLLTSSSRPKYRVLGPSLRSFFGGRDELCWHTPNLIITCIQFFWTLIYNGRKLICSLCLLILKFKIGLSSETSVIVHTRPVYPTRRIQRESIVTISGSIYKSLKLIFRRKENFLLR